MFLPSTEFSGFEFITVARFFIRLIEWVHDLRGDCSHFNFYGCSITQLHHIHKKEQFKLILLSSGSADTWIDAIMSHGERHPRRKPSLFLLVGCLMRARKEKRKPDYLIMPFQPATLTLLWKLFFSVFRSFFSSLLRKFLFVWIGFESENKHTRKRAGGEINDSIDLWFGAGEMASAWSAKSRTATEASGGIWFSGALHALTYDLMVNVFFNSEEDSWKNFLMASIDINAFSKRHTKRADRSESTLPKKKSYQAPWKREDLFEECTQKKLISVEQQWRLVGGNAWARGNRIKAWKSSWLFQMKFMIHCFTLNCTRGKKRKNREC